MDKKQEFILALFAKDEIRFLTDDALKERVKQYEHIYEVMLEALETHSIDTSEMGMPPSSIRVPSWEKAPAWARWTAQDADGEWFWYEEKPSLPEGHRVWAKALNGKVLAVPAGGRNPNYAATLERRP